MKAVARLLFFILCTSLSGNLCAQNIFVSAEQELNFGKFYFSGETGGTVKVSNSGEWTATGNIRQLGAGHQPAAFIISTDSEVPILVRVQAPTSLLTNIGGKTIPIELDQMSPEIYTIQEGSPAHIFIGGTLEIDAEAVSAPGGYNGNVFLRVTRYHE